MQRLASDCAFILPNQLSPLPELLLTKRASPLHPCKRGLNHCVCLFMELGKLLYLLNRNEEQRRRMACMLPTVTFLGCDEYD
jgi:hypothetical protein